MQAGGAAAEGEPSSLHDFQHLGDDRSALAQLASGCLNLLLYRLADCLGRTAEGGGRLGPQGPTNYRLPSGGIRGEYTQIVGSQLVGS
jgi:hypothetical protein